MVFGRLGSIGLIWGGSALIACSPAPPEPPTTAASPSTAESQAPAETEAASPSDSDIAGTYAVTGTGLDGQEYTGTMTIEPQDSLYRVSWTIGDGETYSGLGIYAAGQFSVGWGNESCSVVTYDIEGQALDGEWFVLGDPRFGTEQATRTAGEGTSIAGEYAVNGNNPDGSTYEGTLTIAPQGEMWQFDWQVGNTFTGIGLQQGDRVTVGWGEDNCAIAVYDVTAGELQGTWGIADGAQLGKETAKLQ